VGSGDAMPQRTKADAMTQGGRRTHGHPRGVGVVTGGRLDDAILPALPRGREQRRGIWGMRDPTGGSRLSASAEW
jgi:hypothetical protein